MVYLEDRFVTGFPNRGNSPVLGADDACCLPAEARDPLHLEPELMPTEVLDADDAAFKPGVEVRGLLYSKVTKYES